MFTRHRTATAMAIVVVFAIAGGAQTAPADQAIVQFQRAADAYAFTHRQTERRGAAVTPAIEGALFTPQAAAALRLRIQSALGASGCELSGVSDGGSVVPRVNGGIDGTAAVPACIAAALPKLPAELEYRTAGVALILADAHLHIVIDVLHAAFPQPVAP